MTELVMMKKKKVESSHMACQTTDQTGKTKIVDEKSKDYKLYQCFLNSAPRALCLNLRILGC